MPDRCSNYVACCCLAAPQIQEIQTSENMDKHGADYPLGFGDPIDVANAIVYLLSDASKWVTGTEIVLDGGLTAGK